MSSIIKQIQKENPDVVCFFAYRRPEHPGHADHDAAQLQPQGACCSARAAPASGSTTSSAGALDGVMFEGAWSVNSSPEVKAYYDKLAFVGSADNIDFWGALIYRAELEFIPAGHREGRDSEPGQDRRQSCGPSTSRPS